MNAHNIMEDIVKNYLDDIMDKRPDLCRCSQCIDEIMFKVLNNLPAKYITTDSGAMYILSEQVKVEKSSEILKELIEKIEYLQNNPLHS